MDDSRLIATLEQAIAQFETAPEKYSELLRWWTTFLHVNHCSLHMYSELRQTFTHAQSVELDEAFVQSTLVQPMDGSVVGYAAQRRSVVQTQELMSLPCWAGLLPHMDRLGFRSVWAIPLVWQTRLLGSITVYSKSSGGLDHHGRYLSLYAAQIIAHVLDNMVMEQLDPVSTALHKFQSGVPSAALRQIVRADVLDGWDRSRVAFFPALSDSRDSDARLTDEQLEHARLTQFTLVRAVRQHFTEVLEQLKDRSFALLVCDADGWLIDLMGETELLNQLQSIGLDLGVNLSERSIGNSGIGSPLVTRRSTYFDGSEHYAPSLRTWSSAGAPVVLDDPMRPIGAFAIFSPEPGTEPWYMPFIESARVAISNWVQLDEARQNTVRIHQSVLSHLDYHVICIDPNNRVIEERHPIPLTDDVRAAMVQLAQLGECDQREITLGDNMFIVDVRNVWDHMGHIKGRLALFHDVTKSKQMELRARDADKLSMLTSLTAGIAHEIRNPLTTARGFLQLFSDRMTTETDRQFLKLTITELDRINQLVQDFMSMAKPDTWGYEQVNITVLVDSVSRFIGPEATLLKVTLEVSLPDEDIWVWADPNQMKQVILNIVQNALQACNGDPSTVTLGLAQNGDDVDIVVSDTGCGMTEAQVRRMFQPFYTTKATGTGLGMPISKRIVEEHGGQIHVTSEVGMGTSVRVQLRRLGTPSDTRVSLTSDAQLTKNTLTHKSG